MAIKSRIPNFQKNFGCGAVRCPLTELMSGSDIWAGIRGRTVRSDLRPSSPTHGRDKKIGFGTKRDKEKWIGTGPDGSLRLRPPGLTCRAGFLQKCWCTRNLIFPLLVRLKFAFHCTTQRTGGRYKLRKP